MNLKSDGIDEYKELVNALHGIGSYKYTLKKLDLDLKNRTIPPAKPSIKEPPVLELKAFPSHFQSAFLRANKTLQAIITADLLREKGEALTSVL